MNRTRWLLLVLALVAAALLQTGLGILSRQDLVPGTADSDAHLLFHAQRTFLARSLNAGRLPFWNPYNLLGQPLYAAGQTGATYPPSWLLYPWMNIGRALFADLALHLVLIGIGGALLARACDHGIAGTWTAAAALALSPLLVLRLHAGQVTLVATVAWLPWIAAGFVRLARGDASGRLLTAVSLGLACHAGHIQELYYLLALGLPCWVVVLCDRRDWRGLRDGLCALTLGLCLGAPQLLTTAAFASQSGRTGTDPAWVNEYAARGSDLLALLGVDAFGERVTVPYWGRWKPWEPLPAFGFATLVAAALAPVLSARRRDRALWVMILGALALALGRELPFSRWACFAVPGWARFRDPARVLLVAMLPLALLAARAADILSGVAQTSTRRTLCATALAALTAVALFAAARTLAAVEPPRIAAAIDAVRRPGELFDRVDSAAIAPRVRAQVARLLCRDAAIAALFAVLCLAHARLRPARIVLWAILGTLTLEHLDAGLPWSRTHPPPLIPGDAQGWLDERPLHSRIDLDRSFVPTLATLLEIESPGGSASLMSRQVEALLAISQRRSATGVSGGTVELIRHDGLARIFGVSRAVAAPSASAGTPPPGLAHTPSPQRLRRYERPDPWPRAWIVHAVHRSPNESDELAYLARPGFDPAVEAVLASDVASAVEVTAPPQGSTEAVTLIDVAPERVTAYARLASPGLLVFADAYDPGWRAHGGVTPLRVIRVDSGLRAVALEAGATTVTLTYHPPGFALGVALALAGLLVLPLWTTGVKS